MSARRLSRRLHGTIRAHRRLLLTEHEEEMIETDTPQTPSLSPDSCTTSEPLPLKAPAPH